MKTLLQILLNSTSVEDRAQSFFESIKEDLDSEVLKPLRDSIRKLDDEIHDLQEINLETNVNAGHRAMSRTEAKENFKQILQKTYEKELLERKLAVMQAQYDEWTSRSEQPASNDESES